MPMSRILRQQAVQRAIGLSNICCNSGFELNSFAPPAAGRREKSGAVTSGVPLPTRSGLQSSLRPTEFLLVFVVAVNHTLRPPGDIGHGAVSSIQVETDRAETLGEAGD